eukprot:3813144-Rhodomonas_salina.2
MLRSTSHWTSDSDRYDKRRRDIAGQRPSGQTEDTNRQHSQKTPNVVEPKASKGHETRTKGYLDCGHSALEQVHQTHHRAPALCQPLVCAPDPWSSTASCARSLPVSYTHLTLPTICSV